MTDFGFGALSYGAANVGNLYRALSDEQAHAVLEAAWNAGIRYFDTAPHYGLGLSERRLGDFLATKPRREYKISSKVGRLLRANPEGRGRLDIENDFVVPADLTRAWDFSADGIRRSLDESLARLGLDSIDILYLHDPEKYDLALGISTAIPALAALRDEGLVAGIGVGSMWMPWSAMVAKPEAISSGETTELPSASERLGSRVARTPMRWAYSITRSTPTICASLTATMLRDCARAVRSVMEPM